MKTRSLMMWMLAVVVLPLVSCKDSGTRGANMSAVTGATNEILVVMNKTLWDASVGDTIKSYFGQPQWGLPQPEPLFDVISLPLANFNKNVKSHRNVLIVQISNTVDSASVMFQDSPWARSQKIFKISAPDDSTFFRLFDANKDKIMAVYLKAERDRLIDVYKKTSDTKIFDLFKDKYSMLVYCPGGYKINKDSSDFVWISAETKVDSKGIIFFQEEYKHEGQLNYAVIQDRVNQELRKYIPGPLKNSWMALDTVTPYTATTYNYNGVHYAVMMKGLWTVVNDYMGGPYVLNVVIDQNHNRLIYMLGYVYAPDGKKRNMLRQVESILFSMDIDYNKDAEADAVAATK